MELKCLELPVAYDFVQSPECDWLKRFGKKPLAVINVGVCAMTPKLRLEATAHNKGYDKQDIHGLCPTSNWYVGVSNILS